MNNDPLFLPKLMNTAFSLLIKRSQLDDPERVSIAEFHEAWQPGKGYGSSEYLKYGTTPDGRAQLWMSIRNVPATAPAPDQPASPANWKKL